MRRRLTASLVVLAALLGSSPGAARAQDAAAPDGDPAPWRILDGIAPFFDTDRPPPLSWWMPVSHLDADEAPYVAEAHLERVLGRWDVYCDLAAKRGYRQILLGNVVHVVTFDAVRDAGLPPVYGAESAFRIRHERLRTLFVEAAKRARARGLGLVVDTDFPAWTSEMRAWLGPQGTSLANERLWAAWRAALDELFGTIGLDAVVIRIGEGGGAYDVGTSGYGSSVAVRTIADARTAIENLLGAVEDYNREHGTDKKLIFRTWTIGIGEIGALHTNPELYRAVFEGFQGRPALLVSIKHVAMDFFEYVPRNPTIGMLAIPQIVEFQARREYEGFGLFPNYRAESFRDEIADFARNEQFAGIYVWPANGGFLLRSPTYYGVQGPDDWIDQNVFAYGRLLDDPTLDPGELAREWAREEGLDERDAAALAEILLASDDLVAKGLYVRAFAEEPLPLLGLDLMPTMLWLYWTRPSSGYGVQSLIYRAAAAELATAIAEGHEAVADADALIARAEGLAAGAFRERLLRALRFERSLLALLAASRETFLHHHHWAHGAGASWEPWRASLPRLAAAIEEHETSWADDRFLPAFDTVELRRMHRDDVRYPSLRVAAILLALLDLAAAVLLVLALRAAAAGGEGRLATEARFPGFGPAAALVGAGLLGASFATMSAGANAFAATLALALPALGAWTITALALRVVRPGMDAGLDPRERSLGAEARRALAVLPVPLAAMGVAMLVFAARGPVPFHAFVVEAIVGGGARTALVALDLALGVAALAALHLLAAPAVAGARRWASTPLAVVLMVVVALVAGRAIGLGALPAVNRHLRIGPTVFGEAGTGVEDLVE